VKLSVPSLLREVIHFLPGRGVARWKDVHNLHPGAPTVVLVSGFTAPYRSLSVIRRRLKRDGFNVLVVSLDSASLKGGVSGFLGPASELARQVEKLNGEMRIQPSQIFLLAHSAGGLVARYYIQRLGGYRYCRGLMTLATPHRGTWLAVVGFATHFLLRARCLMQLVPGSAFLRSLNGFPYPPDFPLISLYSRDDAICPPRCSRLPRGWVKAPEIHTVETRRLTHSGFLLRKDAYRSILGYLLQYLKPSDEITQTKSEIVSGT
jgi:triacylglycerol lipase